MLVTRLHQLAQWRTPLQRWTRGRLWRTYDKSYGALFSHAQLHQQWLERVGLPPRGGSLFSIGPAQGELELALCQAHDCDVGYAESFPRYCRELERRFAAAGQSQHLVERHQGPYQGFQASRKYDLILSVHSWYSFGYDVDLLRRSLAMLVAGGSLVLTITSRKDFFFQNALCRQAFSAEDLSAWATENGLAHQLTLLRMRVASERVVADGTLTPAAKGAISFLKGRLWWRIARAERKRIQTRFLQEAVPGASVERVFGLLHFRAAA